MNSLNKSIFYIYTPRWRDNAAGVKALHLLCDAINQKNGSAWLVFSNPSLNDSGVNPDLKTPVLSRKTMKEHQKLGLNASVVYTETIAGNPLRAGRVIRWLLNFPGALGGPTEYSDKEWVISYSGKISEKNKLGSDVLYLPIIDPNELPNGLSKTPGLNLVYAGKYRAFVGPPEIPHNLKYVEIFRDGKKRQPRSEVLELLGKAECLYLWENSSIAVEAMLLDTPCMFIKNPFLGELIAEKELGTAGSGYGFSRESFESAKKTLPEFQRIYLAARANFWNQLVLILDKNETFWGNLENSRIKLPNYFSSNVKHKIFLFFGVIRGQGFLTALKVLRKFISRD
jgi:O-antigen biosynthesis protein